MTAEQTQLRAWFDEHGWQLDPPALRAALEERGATVDLIVELIDEGADRRRAQPDPAPSSNGKRAKKMVVGVPPDAARTAGDLVPPQNLEAEESVLGAMMLSPGACRVVREIVSAQDFYRQSHGTIFDACLALLDRGVDVNAITVTDHLDKQGALEEVGGRVRIHELAALVPATGNAGHYARIVAETAVDRGWIRLGGEASRLGWERHRAPHERADLLRQMLADLERRDPTAAPPPEASQAGDAIFDEPTDTDAIRVWGDGDAIAWAAGEGVMIVGPDGVGKTTLGQQIAIARAGLRRDVLGMPVTPDGRRVLYISADRPRQALRSMRRMVTETERAQLNEAMTIWRGPLPAMLNEDRTILTRLAKQFDAGTVVIDSLKDVGVDLAKDEAGGRIAASFQHLIASGVELLVMHHPRKAETGAYHKPRDLQDTYGSRLIYGVFGSVIMLWGEPGDVLVEFRHLKQPIDEVGPFTMRHDHPHGRTTIEKGTDLLDILLRSGTSGLTARAATELVLDKEDPSKGEIERIRGRLEKLVKSDRVVKLPSIRVGGETRYLFNGPDQVFE